MKTILKLGVLLSFCLIPISGIAKKPSVAKCIDGICVASKTSSRSELLQTYGNGQKKRSSLEPNLEINCFYDPSQQIWVEFEFPVTDGGSVGEKLTGIFVTTVEMCPRAFVPRTPFPQMKTDLGVVIGLSEKKVRENMGAPSRIDSVRAAEQKSPYLREDSRYSSKTGSHRLVYDDGATSLLFNFYGFEHGRLVSMWFANRE
jgi:hypothetical protein